jgi:imidazolonepropionase-like amidohydrolase
MQALVAATSAPARAFRLTDRGRIWPGMRADLVLVDGDPTEDIRDTRNLRAIWKRGAAWNSPSQATEGRPVSRPRTSHG